MRFLPLRQLLGAWPRRLLALGCLLLAAISALQSRPSPGAVETGSAVVTAAHDLVAGSVLGAEDLRLATWPRSLRPASALTTIPTAVGRRLAGSIGANEVITANRLVGTDLTHDLPSGMIAVPVPLVDPGSIGLIHAGDRVDLLSPPAESGQPARSVASGVLVLAVVPGDPSGSMNAQLVVAVDSATELKIAAVITSPVLATVIKPP